jgi:adenosylmethionine-8-amino-7-oxononanoate aminotransferase
MARGLLCYPFGGTVDGVNGDHVLLAPPYIASRDELRTIASLLAESVDAITRHAAIAA